MKGMLFRCALFLMGAILLCSGIAAADKSKQNEELETMLQIFPKNEAWENWLKETGELPPDFDELPSIPNLPDPLLTNSGKKVKTAKAWPKRREELLGLFKHYVIGSIPPPPGNVRAAGIETREEDGATVQTMTLEFGPEHKAKLAVELIIPKGKGLFPVFITQDNHRRWALVAVSRGYIGCVYAGADSHDDTGAFIPIWPDYDWTKLARRAWAASRCIDYLLTLPIVDPSKIALTGHSRNGKLSIIGAALDERITAIISSSSGAGGACTYRFFSETQFGEGIEMTTRVFPDWLHPRLRFFCGRENKLPIDQHELICCIAPRPCLISTGINDPVESVWAIDKTYEAAKPVFDLLGASDALQIRYRYGTHETHADDIEAYVDWLDTQWGRGSSFTPSKAIYPTYSDWLQLSGEKIDPKEFSAKGIDDLLVSNDGSPITSPEQWKKKQESICKRIQWGLGESPGYARSPGGDYGMEKDHIAFNRRRYKLPDDIGKKSFNFGNYIAGDLYFPIDAEKSGKKLPVAIWLHPLSNSNGYVAGYHRGDDVHVTLARAGFAVLAFDQIGNGYRIDEITRFYHRYPHWSLLGKTVADMIAAVDAIGYFDLVDTDRIYVLGYSIGATAGLHAAALHERIAGVVSVAGFTPMRLDTEESGTGGLARWSHWLPLQPRLGAFIGQEQRVPYDYHEVLAMVAPRPMLIVSPKINYQANFGDIQTCVGEVRRVYKLLGSEENLTYYEANDYNHYSPEMQEEVNKYFREMAGL
ncbi:MAG: alpha/beta fold hydrolase [bacterium]